MKFPLLVFLIFYNIYYILWPRVLTMRAVETEEEEETIYYAIRSKMIHSDCTELFMTSKSDRHPLTTSPDYADCEDRRRRWGNVPRHQNWDDLVRTHGRLQGNLCRQTSSDAKTWPSGPRRLKGERTGCVSSLVTDTHSEPMEVFMASEADAKYQPSRVDGRERGGD